MVPLLMLRNSRLCLISLLVSCFLCPWSAAQQSQPRTALRGIPVHLHSSLLQGIQQFVEAQRVGDWDQVSNLLGDFRGVTYRKRYTKQHKECLIEQMKSEPMVSFTTMGIGYSTEILSLPLEQKWWFIDGIAEFDKNGVKAERKTAIIAYRFRGRWFFTPPDYDARWEAEKITEAELNADLSGFLKVEIAPDCPLELVRLSVRMDPEFRSLRRLSFDLRNNSKKEVDGLGFRIVNVSGDGSMMSGMPFKMRPGETVSSPDRIKYSGYGYYCEGESYKRFIIDHVSFKDGSTWSLRGGRKKQALMIRNCDRLLIDIVINSQLRIPQLRLPVQIERQLRHDLLFNGSLQWAGAEASVEANLDEMIDQPLGPCQF